MIRYTLKCDQGHHFESWFKSAAAFDVLQSAGHLSCPECASKAIAKTLMAPPVNLARTPQSSSATPSPDQTPPAPHGTPSDLAPQTRAASPTSAPAPKATQAETQQETDTAIAKMRAHVESTSDYVGKDFASEARKMNDGDAPSRAIYGEAKLEEAKALIDEGVPVIPLPFSPKRKLN